MAHSTRSIFRRLLGFAFFGSGLFLLLEVSARIHLFGFAALVPAQINSLRGLPQTGFTRPAPPDSGLVFELKPNLDGIFKFAPFRTNSRGLRDREYPLAKDRGIFRVGVLGSSFAMPSGVAIEHAFHSLLEEQLSREFAPTRYEFINFAVGMYNPEQVLATLEHRALAYDLDLILFTATRLSMPWLVNGPAASIARMNPAKDPDVVNPFRKSYPILKSYFYRLLMRRLGNAPDPNQLDFGLLERAFMSVTAGGDLSKRPTEENAPIEDREADRRPLPVRTRPLEKSVIVRLGAIAKETQIPVVLIRLEFDGSEKLPIDVEAERLSRANGVHYVDTREGFVGTRPSDFWIHEFDPHPNRAAHRIFAREIATYLRSEHLIEP